jgi:hypothetical protein
MEKEGKKSSIKNGQQEEELSNSEFGFVYSFFISEEKRSPESQELTEGRTQEKRKDALKNSDQSVTFFLPDFFTDEY